MTSTDERVREFGEVSWAADAGRHAPIMLEKPAVPDGGGEHDDAFDGFPVLRSFSRSPDLIAEAPLKGKALVCLLHARPSLVAFMEAAKQFGLDLGATTAVVKDYNYPEKAEVIARLAKLGVRVVQVADLDKALVDAEKRLSGRPFIVPEDGARLMSAIYRRPALLAACMGSVEQTTRGRWVLDSAVSPLKLPHLYLPASQIKPALECFDVGEAVVEAVVSHLAPRRLDGCSVGVIGVAGKVGLAVALSLQSRGAKVYGFDTTTPNYFQLRHQGRLIISASKAEAISGRDIVIGCTGREVLDIRDLPHLQDGVMLVSASSEDIEFPVKLFHQVSKSSAPYSPLGAAVPHGTVYTLHNGKRIILADNGRPVNLGIAAPPERRACFDLVMALMLAGTVEMARGRYAGRSGWIDDGDFDDICRRHDLFSLYEYFMLESA